MYREGEAAEPRTACQGSLIALPSASDLQLKLQRLPPGCSVAAPPSRIIAPGRTQMKSGVHCLQRGTRKEQAGPPHPAGRALSVFCQGKEPASKAEKMGSGGGGAKARAKTSLHQHHHRTRAPGTGSQQGEEGQHRSCHGKARQRPGISLPWAPISNVPCLSISHVRASPVSEHPPCLSPPASPLSLGLAAPGLAPGVPLAPCQLLPVRTTLLLPPRPRQSLSLRAGRCWAVLAGFDLDSDLFPEGNVGRRRKRTASGSASWKG